MVHHLQSSFDGCPVTINSDRRQLHTPINPECMEALFVYVYTDGDSVDVVFESVENGRWTTLGTQRVPSTCFGPLCVLNGAMLPTGSSLYGHTRGGCAYALGYSKSLTVSAPLPKTPAVLSQLVLGHQVISSTDSRPLQLDPNLPLTILHLHYPGRTLVTLAPATVGTVKHIVVASKDVDDASAELKIGSVSMLLGGVGTCSSLVSVGTSWLLLKS